ncbi:hypothetical protein PS627_01206 [Pseudomonas fluorescens]|nr:hypothetical protein PS627_01206 [Pseudomonas fluorescens]
MSYRHRRRSSAPRNKPVYVHAYPRWRFGRWEHVCQHYRSLPHQLTLDL